MLDSSGSHVWCASVEGTISVYNVTTLKCVKVIRTSESPASMVCTDSTIWVAAGNMIMLCNPQVMMTHDDVVNPH